MCVAGAVFIFVVCLLKFENGASAPTKAVLREGPRGDASSTVEAEADGNENSWTRTGGLAHARSLMERNAQLEEQIRKLQSAPTAQTAATDLPTPSTPSVRAGTATPCAPAPSTLCRPADASASEPKLAKGWKSPDPLLAHMGVRYLQIGGDWWNRCNEGWLNIDIAFKEEGLTDNQIGTDNKGAHNMVINFGPGTVLPFRSESVQMVYSEHMLEHMLPTTGGRNWLQELYRVLVPGGRIRLATPDLAKYLCSFVQPAAFTADPRSGGSGAFLQQHAKRFQPSDGGALKWPPGKKALGSAYRPSDATVINNIFRNYDHRWIYDYGEVQRLALDAGVPLENVCRADFGRTGLPKQLEDAVIRATQPQNKSLACWLDQKVRDDESLYVHIVKVTRARIERTH